MSIDIKTYHYNERLPGNDQPEPNYDLDEQRWLALPQDARVAFGIAWLEATDQVFENSSDITAALVDATGIEDEEIRQTNQALLQKGYLDRSGFLTGQALKLSLSDEGYKFLEGEIEKVQ